MADYWNIIDNDIPQDLFNWPPDFTAADTLYPPAPEPAPEHTPAPLSAPLSPPASMLMQPLQQQPQQQLQQQHQMMIHPVSREQEIREMSDYIKSIIESRGNRPDGLSSRVRVHEVILIVLLIADGDLRSAMDFPAGLAGILAFCDEQGKRCSGESGFFKALDTETMALLWQRVYKLGRKSLDEMRRLRQTLQEFAEQQRQQLQRMQQQQYYL